MSSSSSQTPPSPAEPRSERHRVRGESSSLEGDASPPVHISGVSDAATPRPSGIPTRTPPPGPAVPVRAQDRGELEAEGHTSGTPAARRSPNGGPSASSRTPMLITLVVLAVATLMVAVITAASFLLS